MSRYPSLFRCKPPLFSPFWVMLAWLISFHPFCLENCFSRRFTAFTSPWASFRVVTSDQTISASQEFSISLARSTIASATTLGSLVFRSFVPICRQIWSGHLSTVGIMWDFLSCMVAPGKVTWDQALFFFYFFYFLCFFASFAREGKK